MIYFTADCHFGHANIIKHTNRPFASVEEMDETLIQNWNKKVHRNDTVYIVGDLFFRAAEVESTLERLKGKKHLILGNHDKSWIKKVEVGKYFESVHALAEISDGKHGITLCHYPLLSWDHAQRTYMIHGHIHNNTNMDYWPLLVNRERALNAGCDINGFEPVTFDELVENNRRFKQDSVALAEPEESSEPTDSPKAAGRTNT